MDTIIAVILSTFITNETPPSYYIQTNNNVYKLCDSIAKPQLNNYFIYGMQGNKFEFIINKNEIQNIIAK